MSHYTTMIWPTTTRLVPLRGGVVARALWWFDVRVVDGTVNGIAALTQSTGRGIRQIQTGRVQNYALGIAVGLLVIAVSYLFLVR